ncbi:hypothetical protein BB560_001212 [Smittium megazygosporum]|uniref:adenosylmethionine decarboxylase n=1 Tax=Smittium megazygosporum TaxID=133381 RepID=A0A2T9ZIF8_9FUNG|nr:hypothetical protein BB560_001212 [Smittium megazygosporum]
MTLATVVDLSSDMQIADDALQSKVIIGSNHEKSCPVLSLKSSTSNQDFTSPLPKTNLDPDSPLSSALPFPSSNLVFPNSTLASQSSASISTLLNATTPFGANSTYSDGYTGCFEGPEKLLEIWFSRSPNRSPPPTSPSLRSIPRSLLEQVLSLVHCTILDYSSNSHFDSYLLSESSMFVFTDKLILKTCGTTTLLLALKQILNLASSICNFNIVSKLFYSRKSFMFPDKQPVPHNSWAGEVDYLDTIFSSGKSYIIGDLKSDYWHLYVASNFSLKPSTLDQKNIVCSNPPVFEDSDITVEILMTGLDQNKMKLMYCGCVDGAEEGLEGGKIVQDISGLSDIYPTASASSYLFSPCGFSSNGMLENSYFTVHITPEESCSYASFETNFPLSPSSQTSKSDPNSHTLSSLVHNVVSLYNPKQFTVTVFYTSNLLSHNSTFSFKDFVVSLPGSSPYFASDKIFYEIDDYHLRYFHFIKS